MAKGTFLKPSWARIYIAVLLILFGLLFGMGELNFSKNAEKAEAVVKDIHQFGYNPMIRTILIEYTVAGQEYDGNLTCFKRTEIGEIIPIYYDVDNPSIVKSVYKWYIVPVIMILIGAVWIGAEIFLGLQGVRKNGQNSENNGL